MKKGFNNEPVHNENLLKTKTKSYETRINANFHDDGTPKEGFIALAYLQYRLILFLKQVKPITHKCF